MNMISNRFSGFADIVTSFQEIRTQMGEVSPPVQAKVIDYLDDVCTTFIAQSPFAVVASVSAKGQVDLSPKGDPPGFIKVLDERHLAIPDRPGNRRADTFKNLLENPEIGLLFIIPGKTETLRVSGEARIVRDRALREQMAVNQHIPEFATVVYVERAFIHCPKCMIRSKLWQPEAWPDSANLDDIGEAMIKHAKLDLTPEELFLQAESEGLTKLY